MKYNENQLLNKWNNLIKQCKLSCNKSEKEFSKIMKSFKLDFSDIEKKAYIEANIIIYYSKDSIAISDSFKGREKRRRICEFIDLYSKYYNERKKRNQEKAITEVMVEVPKPIIERTSEEKDADALMEMRNEVEAEAEMFDVDTLVWKSDHIKQDLETVIAAHGGIVLWHGDVQGNSDKLESYASQFGGAYYDALLNACKLAESLKILMLVKDPLKQN